MPASSEHSLDSRRGGLRVGIMAGEASGDLLGAGLVHEIRRRYPDATFHGIGGPAMIAEGVDSWVPMERLSVMGLAEVIRHLPELLRIRKRLVRGFQALQPDVVIGIDSPDFNLRVEGQLRAAGIRTVHYVSPSIWAWRASRIDAIGRATDHVLCLLPFEPALYAEKGIPATFIGHPMADTIPLEPDQAASRAALGIVDPAGARELVALLPGSRTGEVERLGGAFAAAAALLAARHPGLRFIAPMASAAIRARFEALLAEHAPGLQVERVDGRSREVMAASDLVLLASGTATLEAALLKRPMVMAYRVAPLTAWMVRALRLMKTRRFALPNVLAGEDLVPELLQEAANPERIAREFSALLGDAARRAHVVTRFAELHDTLRQGADRRAAEVVLRLVNRWPPDLEGARP
ncbi:lipid-A-disaccharide synthase [Wenzhouxiangella sp. XN24]|uniref:lipid-A-disaccharide synthase n=1 Tax=Wenzhouxiangella sp. XN24 TaxID=2713569 RepID=UPI0019811211|nr:lipid-A-disaccharide synthase [Wenzhouxiangella sp. XN24]